MLISIAGDVWRVRIASLSQFLLKEVVIEPNVKLECVPKFCYLGREEVWRMWQEPE